MQRRKTATLKDVSVEAGVSSNTASRALKGDRSVTIETTRRVRAAAERLGYESSREQTGLLGLVTPKIAHPFYGELLEHFQDYCAQQGYLLTFARTDGDDAREQKVIQDLDDARVEGLMLLSPTMSEATLAKILGDGRRPIVVMNATFKPRPGLLCIAVDNSTGVRRAVEHLLSYGHGDRLAYLNGPGSSRSNLARQTACETVLAEHHLSLYWESPPQSQPADYESGYKAGNRMLQETGKSRPSAVLAYNDLMALGCITAVVQAGLKVPQDISIVGFDDLSFAPFTNPPLTTVSIPRWRMATTAIRKLITLVEQGPLEEAVPEFIPSLIERKSTGPASKAA